MNTPPALLETVTSFYLESGDFNGVPVQELGPLTSEARTDIRDAIAAGTISVNFGDRHPNPHINALDPEPIDTQLRKLEEQNLEGACLYPTEAHMQSVLPSDAFLDRPFTRRLALGEPQLRFYVFDTSILETYRNDPRYLFLTDDISGRISVAQEHDESDTMAESDAVLLQTFGFAYDANRTPAVAVFLRYLHDLTAEHQQMWNARRRDGDFKLHPDYARESAGDWGRGASTLTVFLEEMREVNVLCEMTGRPKLFRNEYDGDKRPKKFTFLLRPSLDEFQAFVLLLDKMISDNIDPAFFGTDVARVDDEGRQKGTLRLLREWFELRVRVRDPAPRDEMLETFNTVRELRMRPAHAIEEDRFEPEYLEEQRRLMAKVCGGTRTLRLILQNHPNAWEYAPPSEFADREIWPV
jgi:hypothetical protein